VQKRRSRRWTTRCALCLRRARRRRSRYAAAPAQENRRSVSHNFQPSLWFCKMAAIVSASSSSKWAWGQPHPPAETLRPGQLASPMSARCCLTITGMRQGCRSSPARVCARTGHRLRPDDIVDWPPPGRGEFATARAICANEIRIAEAADCLPAILLAPGPQVAPRKAQKYRPPPGAALKGMEHFLTASNRASA
jgi:hypothetical protein